MVAVSYIRKGKYRLAAPTAAPVSRSVDIDKNALLWFFVFHWAQNFLSFDCRTTINSVKLILTPPKSKGSPFMMKNLKNCLKTVFDSSKEASWCTECNAKKSHVFTKYGFYKNQEENFKNCGFGPFLVKMSTFWGFSWFFQKPYFVRSWGWGQCIRTLLLCYQEQHSDKFSDFSS